MDQTVIPGIDMMGISIPGITVLSQSSAVIIQHDITYSAVIEAAYK